MQRESFGFLKILPIWVALMSGLFSIIREVANLYPPTQMALWDKKLFWTCVWVTFVVSSLAAWFLKNRELMSERAKNSKPDIRGEIEEVHYVLAWDVRSPENKALHDCYLTIKARIVNKQPAPTTLRFQLKINTPTGQFDSMESSLEGLGFKKERRRATTHVRISVAKSTLEDMADLAELCRRPLTIGDEQEGWLRFVMPTAENPGRQDIESVTLIINDTFGGSCNLTASKAEWKQTGEIVTRLSEEIARRKEEAELKRLEEEASQYL